MTWIIWGTSHDLGNLYIIFSNSATHSAPKKTLICSPWSENPDPRRACLLQGIKATRPPTLLNLIFPMGNAKCYAVNGQGQNSQNIHTLECFKQKEVWRCMKALLGNHRHFDHFASANRSCSTFIYVSSSFLFGASPCPKPKPHSVYSKI